MLVTADFDYRVIMQRYQEDCEDRTKYTRRTPPNAIIADDEARRTKTTRSHARNRG
ncbi:hypothetical protein BSF38_02996 [Paludisphaera borealis]|uniref:Uncharacterized protein n=1 Tax=Paludisphaera borealis TaxID=1387353 RepID=A0A1U7CRC2_9BACT|nr:hypothetical protein BSF38_02996 [Paludisphaera borealis]